jgi:hypothetical protein
MFVDVACTGCLVIYLNVGPFLSRGVTSMSSYLIKINSCHNLNEYLDIDIFSAIQI